MLAAVFEGDGKLVLKERAKPRIAKATDVLLKVQGVGICGTDLHILQVPPAHPATVGVTLGHDELARPAIPVAELLRKEITIFGSFIGTFSFHKLPRILVSGVLPLEHIVSHRLPLSRVHESIGLLRRGEAIKIVLHPEEF